MVAHRKGIRGEGELAATVGTFALGGGLTHNPPGGPAPADDDGAALGRRR